MKQRLCFLDLGQGDVALFHKSHSIHERFADHGAGILLTIAKQCGYDFDTVSLSALHSWAEWRLVAKRYDAICMNVRSWRYIYAKRAAEIAKSVNPNVQIWVGGMHATVARQEMEAVDAFDVIVSREAEGTFLELLANGGSDRRFVEGNCGKYANLDDLPFIDRELWPRTPGNSWPLESPGNWGDGPRAATMITSRKCPFKCSYCYPAELNHFGAVPKRRSVGNVIEELNMIDKRWGPFSMTIFHEGEFLMHKAWLEEYLNRYTTETPTWPFWASCRSDLLVRWRDLVEALIKEAHWHCVSIGLESGSDRVLQIMNKGTTAEQNMAAIEIINRIGDELQAQGKRPPVIFANVMLAIPGEEPEDAFATFRMMGKIKRCIPSLSLFTPYPGSVLGDQMIAEGRSLDVHKTYLRFPNEAKVRGIDYGFYQDLFQGRHDREVGLCVPALMAGNGNPKDALV